MGQIRPSLGKGSNATIPRHMGFSTPICRRAVSDPFCIFFPMMIFWKIKVNYVYLANFKLESGLRIRVTILDRRRRQRVKDSVWGEAPAKFLTIMFENFEQSKALSCLMFDF